MTAPATRTGAAPDADAPAAPMVWNTTTPSGAPAGLVSFGSTAAPLLAGFSMSTAVALSGRSMGERGLRGDIAIGLFAVAAAVLIFAIQSALTAVTYQTSPTDRMASLPQARQDDAWLLFLREQQWAESRLAARYRRRTRIAFNTGIVSFLSALTTSLLPGPGGWTWPRTVAVAVAAAAAALEVLLWMHWPPALASFLTPRAGTDELVRGGNGSNEMPAITRQELRRILYGDPAPAASEDNGIGSAPQLRQRLLDAAARHAAVTRPSGS